MKHTHTWIIWPGRDAVPVLATIKQRKQDSSGVPTGEPNSNPILDSRVYEVEFPDRQGEEYLLNTLVESMIAQTDGEVYNVRLLDEIIDFRKDDSIALSQMMPWLLHLKVKSNQ